MKISAKAKAQHSGKFAPRENNPLYGIGCGSIVVTEGTAVMAAGTAVMAAARTAVTLSGDRGGDRAAVRVYSNGGNDKCNRGCSDDGKKYTTG